MNAKRRIYDHDAQRWMDEYLRNSHYDEHMALIREGWLENRQLARTSRQFLHPTPSPPVRKEEGEDMASKCFPKQIRTEVKQNEQ